MGLCTWPAARALPPVPPTGTRIWYWQSQEDKFPNATNPKAYAAFNKFDLASSTAPINCLAASWNELFTPSGASVNVFAWTGRTCATQLPFMCKRKRERGRGPAAPAPRACA
jgi:hypothetical protein